MSRIRSERAILRELLTALLREQPESSGLVYLPSGCREMRRMIENLQLLRPSHDTDDEIGRLTRELLEFDTAHS